MTAGITSSHRLPAGGRRFRCRSPVAAWPRHIQTLPPVTPKSPCRKRQCLRSYRCSGSATVYSADQRTTRASSPAVKSP
jgi:hypothetical protein